jgi:hypothetical protein
MQVPSLTPRTLQVESNVPLFVPWPQGFTWQTPCEVQTVTRSGQSLVCWHGSSHTRPPAQASKAHSSGHPQSSWVWQTLNSTGGAELGQPVLPPPPLLLPPPVWPPLLAPLVVLPPPVVPPLLPFELELPLLLEPGSQMPRSGSALSGSTQGPAAGQVVGLVTGLHSVSHWPLPPTGRQTMPGVQAFWTSARVAAGSQTWMLPPPW